MESVTYATTENPPAEDAAAVDAGLGAFNRAAGGTGAVRRLACFARAPDGRLVGGAVGRTWGRCCELQQLWVDEKHRGAGVGRELVRLRTGVAPLEPLSGQRLLSPRARAACFPLAPGFGCEVRMTIDALRAGLTVEEIELDLDHRATRRDATGFLHRGHQLFDAVLATGPLGVNYRGLRLPLAGWVNAGDGDPGVVLVTLFGVLDDAFSGEERGFRAHLRGRRTTGVLKAVGIPLVGLWRTRSVSGALLVALWANLLNQLDTRPGRCLKAYLLAAVPLRAPLGRAVLLLPYDLAERAMLGDAGANAFGAVLGLKSVDRFHGWRRWAAIGTLAGLNLLGERTSTGRLIERTPGLRELDRLGRLR